MDDNKKAISTINHVIRINKDRIEGYQKAADETKDENLKNLFNRLASDSVRYRDELTAYLTNLGGDPAEDTTQQGKVYRAWMDVKAAVTGHDRKAIIASCEFGEDAALEAYDDALKSEEVPSDAREILQRQRLEIQKSHDNIKAMRDAA